MTVDFGLSLEEQCAAIWDATERAHADLERERRTPPLIRLWTGGNADLVHIVECEDSARWEDPDNDTGPGVLKMDFALPQAQWLNDMYGRIKRGEKRNVLVSMDYMGNRWSGLLEEVNVETDELGTSTLTATFLSDFEQLRTKLLWATPVMPAAFQPIKVFGLAGPAPWVCLSALHINLVRENSSLLTFPDDPLNPSSWWSGNSMSNWTVVVKPTSFMEWMSKGVPWAILTSRFKYWHEAAQSILEDAELSLRWRRWFTGDPAPWPGAKLRHGALVVWIEDKSGVEAGTSNGGTLFDGLFRTIRSYTEDFVENLEEQITDMPVVGDYRVSGDRRTDPRVPYVYYPPDSPGVRRSSFKQRPARAVQLVTGGHSMPGVNETISALTQGIFDVLGNWLMVGSIGGSVDALLKPFYEDCVAGDTIIHGPDGDERIDALAARGGPFRVWSLTPEGRRVPATAVLAFKKGRTELFEYVLDDGRAIKATHQHRFLTREGFMRGAAVVVGTEIATVDHEDLPRQAIEVAAVKVEDAQYEDLRETSALTFRKVVSVQSVGVDDFYDMHVPGWENYSANGFWNHNTILAWIAVKLFMRAQVSGDFRYFEYFIASAGKAYTLDSLMVLRAGAFETRTIFSGAMEITNAAPYAIGAAGIGHFDKGDRVATRIPGDLTRRIHVERVSKTVLEWDPTKFPEYEIVLGGERLQEDPLARLMRHLGSIRSDLKDAGVF